MKFNGLSWIAVSVSALLVGCASTPVLRDGRALLPIVVAADASVEERAAAAELAGTLEKMSGSRWPVREERRSGTKGIHIGWTEEAARHGPRLVASQDLLALGPSEVGRDDFRIRFRAGSVLIEGATLSATEYAVAWFLQSQAGVRWYAPGQGGEVVPHRRDWSLPKRDLLRKPAYVSREIHGSESSEEAQWALRNGLRRGIEFSHALNRVFPPPLLAAFPEWAPELRGTRYQPSSPDDYHWQPNLALPAVAEIAAKRAAAAFDRDTTRTSFSLGINDSMNFDQSELTRSLVEPMRYFRGMPDYSSLVFTFMNRAVEALPAGHAHRYLGCLAYFWCERPPAFPVHPQVMPYVTTDRSQYYDRDYRAADFDLMSRWKESGVRAFGLWEYGYGQSFLIPRVPHRALAEAIAEGWKRGARGYFADTGPQRGFDTFKVWMLAQLLWQPTLSYTQLADDFFEGYYGAAAEPMRHFFEACERQWMKQEGAPVWIKYYQQEDQALLFPPEVCAEFRRFLDDAERRAKNDEGVQTRVRLTSKAFAVTEAFVAFDATRRELSRWASDEPDFVRDRHLDLARSIETLRSQRLHLERVFSIATAGPNPAMEQTKLTYFVRNDPVPRLLWEASRENALAGNAILDAAGVDAEDEPSWRSLTDFLANGQARLAENIVQNSSFALRSTVSQRPAFLYPLSGSLPANWEIRATPTEQGQIALVDRPAANADRVLRIQHAWDTQVYQWVAAKAGESFVAFARMGGRSSPGNDSSLFLSFLSSDGKPIGVHRMQSLPKGQSSVSRTMVMADCAPEGAAWVGVGVGSSRQGPDDVLDVESVELRRTGP